VEGGKKLAVEGVFVGVAGVVLELEEALGEELAAGHLLGLEKDAIGPLW